MVDDDAAVVRALLQRDEKTFVALVDAHHQALLRLAQNFVSSQAVAEEVVQETWLAVIKGIDGFEGRSRLKTWIFRILVNRAKTRGGREGRSIPFSALSGDAEDTCSDPERFSEAGHWKKPPSSWSLDRPDSAMLRRESMQLLRKEIGKLPANQQIVVTLRDVQGCSSSDVCNILEISESNQRVLLHRARSHLRDSMEAFYREQD